MKLKEFLNQSDRFAANVGARLTEVEEVTSLRYEFILQ